MYEIHNLGLCDDRALGREVDLECLAVRKSCSTSSSTLLLTFKEVTKIFTLRFPCQLFWFIGAPCKLVFFCSNLEYNMITTYKLWEMLNQSFELLTARSWIIYNSLFFLCCSREFFTSRSHEVHSHTIVSYVTSSSSSLSLHFTHHSASHSKVSSIRGDLSRRVWMNWKCMRSSSRARELSRNISLTFDCLLLVFSVLRLRVGISFFFALLRDVKMPYTLSE